MKVLFTLAVFGVLLTLSCSSDDSKEDDNSSYTGEYGTLTDSRDSNKEYKTVLIGTQTWMAENLNYDVSGSVCNDNEAANCDKYGRLYNWATATTVCPEDWHLPTKEEWETLENYVGGSSTAGRYLKATSGWDNNGNGYDKYGFAALPGGMGYSGSIFSNDGETGYWWSASESSDDNAQRPRINHHYEDVSWLSSDKGYLYSIRCVKD